MAPAPALTADDWLENSRQTLLQEEYKALPLALVASLVVHGAIVMLLVILSFSPGLQPVPAASPAMESIAITLVRRSADPEETDILLEEPDTPGQAAGVVATESATETTVLTAVEQVPVPAPLPVQEETGTATLPESTAVNDRAATMAMVTTAIAGYRDVLKTDLNREFVEGCIRRRNRYGPTTDCPESFAQSPEHNREEKAVVAELFAAVTRDADHARMSWKLEQENELLASIMEAGGPAGDQAAIRWQLNRQYHAYLNDNILPELTFRSQTAFVNDYNRTITPAPFQFRCKEIPCIYKYTGFTVKRPENYVQMEPSFAVIPPLFKSSQD